MKLTWQTFAGGTCAAEGKHSYAAYESVGQYHVDPLSWPNGRHRCYDVKFADTQGKLKGLLWHSLGTVSSPNDGKAMCLEHARQYFNY